MDYSFTILWFLILIIWYFLYKLYLKHNQKDKTLVSSSLEVIINLDLNYANLDYKERKLKFKTFNKDIYKFTALDICKDLELNEQDNVLYQVAYVINNWFCNCKITYMHFLEWNPCFIEDQYTRNIWDRWIIDEEINLIKDSDVNSNIFKVRINSLGLLELWIGGRSRLAAQLFSADYELEWLTSNEEKVQENPRNYFTFLWSLLLLNYDKKKKILELSDKEKVTPLNSEWWEFEINYDDSYRNTFIDFFWYKDYWNYRWNEFISFSNKYLTIKYKQDFYNQN